jgi:RimJ/RimL family protein N-acetyltransferase
VREEEFSQHFSRRSKIGAKVMNAMPCSDRPTNFSFSSVSLRFRPPTLADAELLLDWRTSSEIARQMYSEISYDLEQQKIWLQSVSQRDDYCHFIIENLGESIGYLSYSRIDRKNLHCVPGFYVGSRSPQAAIAVGCLHWFIMDYAFYGLGMNKVISEVLASNTRLIRSLRLLKETEVGIFRQHICKNDVWHDVHLFELLRETWENQPHPFDRPATLEAFGLIS